MIDHLEPPPIDQSSANHDAEVPQDELLGSAGYFVRTDLRAGASCPHSYFRWGNECKPRGGMEC